MIEEKLYRDEDLTLKKLADHLSLKPNQLSEFLNNHLNRNFNSYVNFYRVEEAKKILIEEMERTIISIAYLVGFNSKSVFNTSFSKFTGMSPAQYRKRGGEDSHEVTKTQRR